MSRGIARINIILPYVFLIGIFLPQFWLWQPRWGGNLHRTLMFIAEILFLNYLHVAFTFVFIFSFPSGREWLVLRTTRENKILFFKSAVICLALGALYAVGLKIWVVDPKVQQAGLFLMVLINSVWFVQHGLAQIKGLSLVYHRQWEKGDSPQWERDRVLQVERWERRLYWPLILSASISFCFSKWLLVGDYFGESVRKIFLYSSAGLALVLSVTMVAINLRLPRILARQKLIFTPRILFSSLMGVNYVAFMGRLCTHGFEYWEVYSNMKMREQKMKKTAAIGVATLLTVLAAFLLHTYGNDLGGLAKISSDHSLNPAWIRLLALIFLVSTPLHYYLDWVIFKMRDPHTRNFTGRLLLKE